MSKTISSETIGPEAEGIRKRIMKSSTQVPAETQYLDLVHTLAKFNYTNK